ncbi:hypothetical protein LOK74_05845 [Brevibacillus humidisoli]|uniref:hypothetical protein n=1 Tax=Brevibacillus humidisoli TaxID=2895522 RepID=UPI001E50F2F0|nr:hypothetical protein [Brevibacillus humidisoli]UFJ42020.1 hypothetical protein LOK74_05845 [Brevibacillus humidisoli]
MSNQQVNELLVRLDQSAQAFNQLSGNMADPNQVQNIAQSVQAVTQKLANPNTSMNHQQIETIRKQITQIRQELENLDEWLEESSGQLASLYRSSLGDTKPQFENAPAVQQQTMNAYASQTLQAYRKQAQVSEHLHQLNADLMALSHQLEQQTYSSQIPVQAPGEPLQTDHDPEKNIYIS